MSIVEDVVSSIIMKKIQELCIQGILHGGEPELIICDNSYIASST